MDEQRFQAYVGLIKQLLDCEHGEESELFVGANAELVDEGLVATMEQVARYLEHQEEHTDAEWLRVLKIQLSQILGLLDNGEKALLLENAEQFLLKTLEIINQTDGDPRKIYPFWIEKEKFLDISLLNEFPEIIEKLFLNMATQKERTASILVEFGNLICQFSCGIRWLNVELAIIAYESALQVRTREAFPELWTETQNNLGLALSDRIKGDRPSNLDQAIFSFKVTLDIRTCKINPEQEAMIQNNLANAYVKRSLITRHRPTRKEYLKLAIENYKLALRIRNKESFIEEWATTQNGLAVAYSYLAQIDSESKLKILSNSIYKKLIRVYKDDLSRMKKAATYYNLGNNLSQANHAISKYNILQAIVCYKLSLNFYKRDTHKAQWAALQCGLAIAFSKYIHTGSRKTINQNPEILEQVIDFYKLALEIYTPDNFPYDNLRTGRALANFLSDENRWDEAAKVYKQALLSAGILYQSCLLISSQSIELNNINDLHCNAAYAFTKFSHAQKANDQKTTLKNAIIVLETNRARCLSESLVRDRANLTQLQQLAPQIYTQYQNLTQQLRNLESQQRDRMVSADRNSITPEAFRNEATRLRKDLEETIAQIRQVPGYEGFLTPIKWENIQKAVTLDRPLVYLVTTPNGGMALTVTVNSIEVLWLDNLNENTLLELLKTWFGTYLEWTAASQQFRDDSSEENHQAYKKAETIWLNTIETTTLQLWDLLMGPIVQQLKAKGFDRATLIPTGFLSLLPLHAAWTIDDSKPTGKRYAIDDIHFTYTPNAKSLTEARAIADRPFTDSILAIDNPRQDLPNSQREIDCAIDSFSDRTVLRHDNATIDAVKSGLSKAAIVHFSCHGTANFTEPLNSGLLMSDGLLTLKDLLALNLAQDSGIRLAILSACETGLPGLDNIDEVVSLPIGLLQAGVAGVISSLWSVDDASTMMLLTRFYDLWRKDGLEPSIALREAQIWLRDTTAQEKKEMYSHFMFRKSTLNDRTCEHPFHWAAFSYLGV